MTIFLLTTSQLMRGSVPVLLMLYNVPSVESVHDIQRKEAYKTKQVMKEKAYLCH
jgi:hypothetical protein